MDFAKTTKSLKIKIKTTLIILSYYNNYLRILFLIIRDYFTIFNLFLKILHFLYIDTLG